MRKNKLLLLLVLLMTAATGARAAWTGGTYTATANENLGAITVNGDATLTINSDVIVTVTGGINVASGTLTVKGPGTLVVTGAKGNNGASGMEGGTGGNGGVAISGNIIVQGGATVTATGGNGGNGGKGDFEGGNGGNGGVAIAGTLTYKSGTVTANGGSAGSGGWGDDMERYASSGSAGKAFANDVDFTQTTGYSVTDGSSTIGSVLNQTKVVISGGTDPSSGYTVSMKDGVKDADKWTVKVGEGEAQALPIGGLKGDGSETVTLQYNGRLKVKGVKATSEAGAPAANPIEVLTYSFDDASHPSGLTAGSRVSFDYSRTSVITNSKFLNAYNNTNGDPNATTVSLGDTDLSGETWTLSFEWAACGGCNSKPDHTTLKAGNATLFDLNGNSNWNTTVTIIYTGSDGSKTLPVPGCDKSNRFTAAVGDQYNTTTYWHHIVVKGSAEGVKMTITNSSTGAAVVEDVVLSETNVNPTSLIIEPSCGGGIGIDALSLTYDPTAQAKPAATVTTAPTGAAIVGVGKSTALVSGGVADGGTLMYAVTTTNTKPASTDGFSDAVPTAQTITASGTVYVWYYVKGDDTHSDSEIAATAIEVPVADIVWDVTNVRSLRVMGTFESYEREGVTLSANAEQIVARWRDKGDPTTAGIQFEAMESGGYTFTAPTGKKFTKIEMTLTGFAGWDIANLGSGWSYSEDGMTGICKVTWKGTAASTVGLLTGANNFGGERVKSIAFYLSE